jgi:hypothetical protein
MAAWHGVLDAGGYVFCGVIGCTLDPTRNLGDYSTTRKAASISA